VTRRVAEAFHPGVFIEDELEARNWSQADLAEILARPPRLISELISGTRNVSPETAKGLGEAFGTGAELWMRLQNGYDLHRAEENASEEVARRAKLFSKVPIRDMGKRGWLEVSENISVMEHQVCRFLGIRSLDEEHYLCGAFRSSASELTIAHTAWCHRAINIARTMPCAPFTKESFESLLERLRPLMVHPKSGRMIAPLMAEHGIRLVVVEHLPKTRIDGACLRVDRDKARPVIALSLRHDRIDSAWYTLCHELGHLARGHEQIDIDLGERDHQSESEQEADRFAMEMMVPSKELDSFIARVGPLYSHAKIVGFANRLEIHPGIVVGQLQFRKAIGYQHSRKFLVKIREEITASALTDGWGSMLPSAL
jgi:HTH-type transcriptional regulator / antitoxin HigA